MKKLAVLLAFLLCLSAFAAAGAEDAFEPIPWDSWVSPNAPLQAGYLPDSAGYHDDSIDVRIETMRRDDTNIMLAYVTIADASQLRTTTAQPGVKGSKRLSPVHVMAAQSQAVLAINGDYFNYHTDGIAIRNQFVYREKPNDGRDSLIIDTNGDFTILAPTTKESWAAYEGTPVHVFCFGPGLVIDGEPLDEERFKAIKLDCGKGKKTQRIAIGQTGPLQYLVVTTEGPENKDSVGFDLMQMAQLCKDLGCVNAYNLDGGSSSAIVLNNQKINALSSGKVRSVCDIIYFATLVKGGAAE